MLSQPKISHESAAPLHEVSPLLQHAPAAGALGIAALADTARGLALVGEAPVTEVQQSEQDRVAELHRAEIRKTFVHAEDILVQYLDSPAFEVHCRKQGVDSSDTASPAYWQAFSLFTSARRAVYVERGMGNKRLLDSLTLLAATPGVVHQQGVLDTLGSDKENFDIRSLSSDQLLSYNQARKEKSEFNKLLQNFVEANPDIHIDDFKKGFGAMLQLSIPIKKHALANQTITMVLRGAQHEIGFGQLLEESGVYYRKSNTEEDLKGIDYVVALRNSQRVEERVDIDVKASTHEVKDLGFKGMVGRRRNGTLVMHSGIPDKAFNGKFYLDSEDAKRMAPVIVSLIESAHRAA